MDAAGCAVGGGAASGNVIAVCLESESVVENGTDVWLENATDV